MKRFLDLSISMILILIFFPIMIIIGLLIKVKLGSPVIYKQQRPGLYGTPFILYKFRTMTDQRDGNGELLPDRLRLVSFGRVLRKFSFDEFPQLINVIKGELSLVGPRPLLMEYLPLYSKEQAKRHLVKPGITGWAQINGRNAITWEEKFKLDIWYVDNQSIILDIKILCLTFLKVMKSEGINQTEHVPMEKFKGTNTKISEGHG